MPSSHPFNALCLILCCALAAQAQRASVAVLDFGETEVGRRAGEELAARLREQSPALVVASRGAARAAAKGAGYAGSLNLSLEEARDLGAAVGADFLVAGAADTVRRQSFARPLYFESYASVFAVSSFTGRLVAWQHLSAEAETAADAEREMSAKLRAAAGLLAAAVTAARERERAERKLSVERDTPVIEDAPEEGTDAAKDFRVPLPYRRIRPDYTAEAARAGAEATIDALVELDAAGEVKSVEIVRWGGYGLDESVAATIRRMHFRPALREGKAIPVRVLLRYNFRRPKEDAGKR